MGSYLSTPNTEKCSQDGENGRLRYGSSAMQGWRTTMEDALAAFPDLDSSTSFFGVYDGHAGKQVALFCAKHLHQQMVKDEAYTSGDLVTSIQNAYLRMDEMMQGEIGWRELAMLQGKLEKISDVVKGSAENVGDGPVEEESHSDFSGPNAGSTACVAIIRDKQLIIANAGDSRCVISKNGQACSMSVDHKPDLENERERILKAGGSVRSGRVNGSLNLSRAIGDMQFKKNIHLPAAVQAITSNPEINTVELSEEDEFLVVACDGIWDCMSNQELVDYVHEQLKTESKLSEICERVLDKCLAPTTTSGDGCDNMTMVLVQFKKSNCSVSSQGLPVLPD